MNRQNRLRNLCILLTILLAASMLSAQAEQEEGRESKVQLTELQKKMKKKVSVDFRETPIDDVIRIMTKQADVDVVKSPNVTGEITATITDVPLDEALENILAAHGYAYVVSESMIRIVPRSEILVEAEKVYSKVFRITYADTATVATAIDGFLSDKGEMAVNNGTSNILVTDVESKIKAIDQFILEVDRITPQMVVEARVYDISTKDRLDVGVNWSAGTNTLFDSAGNVIGGITNSYTVGEFLGSTSFTESADAAVRFGILNNNVNIDALVRAEDENVDAKLLANPRIMVLDNEEASIKIISEIPFQELTQTSGGGSIGTTEFKEVGVELAVRPHMTRDGMIRLHIRPKFSVQTGEVPLTGVTGITSPQPIVDTREADTITLVQDGQTVVMGGMRKQDLVKQKNKVPLLGDIPLLGAVFRFEGEELINSELVVFITPRLVGTHPQLTPDEQHKLDSSQFDPPDPARMKSRRDEPVIK